jgi:hypothetical protein
MAEERREREGRETYTVANTVVGIVVVIVVHCVLVSVTNCSVFVAVTVTTEASGALFLMSTACNFAALSSTNCFLTSVFAITPLLNFAELTFWKMVLRIVISIFARGSGIQFGVGETQEGVVATVV